MQPKHQKKVDHMRKVTSDCSKHVECREMDKLRVGCRKTWMDTMLMKVEEQHGDREEGVSLGQLIGSQVRDKFLTSSDDLLGVTEEEKLIVSMSKMFKQEVGQRLRSRETDQ